MSVRNSSGGMTPAQFVAQWSRVSLSERAASHEHFIDLCRMLGQPTPAEHDATGAEYTFEKGVAVTDAASKGSKGAGGFADVWWRGKFGWEYKRKGKHRDLTEAYRQLCQYREALENPPLLIVCDIARTEIHTNFTGFRPEVHTIELDELDRPERLSLLRRVFTDPESFRPTVTTETVTKEVAEQIGMLAQSLQQRDHDPHQAAHFLMKCMFCLFAEDVGLLPNSLFTRLLEQWKDAPGELTGLLTDLFAKMRTGGAFGTERIPYFNGGLFDESPALPLTGPEVGELLLAAKQDWSAVEPAIFGTLFERSLDPSKRAQIGAHYTSREDILLVIEPVIMTPLRREWSAVQAEIDTQLDRRRKATTTPTKRKADAAISNALTEFLQRLSELRILDPACGSGNFLYVAIQQLLDLEKEVITRAASPEIGLGLLPTVRPTQLHGIEINPYAAELAQVVIWIGYLQWMQANGFNVPRDPILEPLQSIECRDAILDLTDSEHPVPAAWPDTDFIVGNPPFLGDKLLRGGLGDEYVDMLFSVHQHAIPNGSDLCCYWFEKARGEVEMSKALRKVGPDGKGRYVDSLGQRHSKRHYLEIVNSLGLRVGLLATQGIRGGGNREVLKRIKETGDIFLAWSDREWILDGASVHVSIIGFDDGTETTRVLDTQSVASVNADLTRGADLTQSKTLAENADLSFLGSCKGGSFDIAQDETLRLLRAGGNPNRRSNTDVMRPVTNSSDLLRRNPPRWIIDNADLELPEACQYELPHAVVEERVRPVRERNRNRWLRENWWRPQRMRPEMRRAVVDLKRFLVTPTTAKHRVFVWLNHPTLPDHQLIVFARSDDSFFGVLHSSVHELWARRVGTQLREAESGFRYTPTTCFETFALPWSPGGEPGEKRVQAPALRSGASPRFSPQEQAAHARISAAAAAINEQRERWLNPPEWIDPLARQVDAQDDFADVPEEARALIRRSAIMSLAAQDKDLKKRTLTNLYNERPTWLKLAHQELDRAVLGAYAAVDPDGDWAEDWADVWVDTGAGQPLPDDHPLAARRAEVDQKVLENLLRLNLARAGTEES